MFAEAGDVRLAKHFSVARSSFANLQETPFQACHTQQVDGALEQRSTVDQFHASFHGLKDRYATPTAMCGYFSAANALLLSLGLPARWTVTRGELDDIFDMLEKPSVVAAEVEKAMAFVHACRQDYVDSHASDFCSPDDVAHYMSDWVANYEISDYLAAAARQGSLTRSVHFFRYNQMPEIESATHEERTRLQEESCFGRALAGEPVCKGTAQLEQGGTRFFAESFLPHHALFRPEQWKREHASKCDEAPPVFVVDVNGHFVVAVPLIIEASANCQGGRALLVLNTTRGSYIHSPALVYLFDLVWGTPCSRV
jgi:hypothetical protein